MSAPVRWLRQLFLASLILAFVGGAFASTLSAGALFPNPVFPVGSNPYGLVVEDFDGDGLQDLIASNYCGYICEPGDLSFLKGLGDGTFAPQVHISTSPSPRYLLAADFNRDSRPDLVVVHESSAATLMLNQGGGTFAPESSLPTELFVYEVRAGDFDGNGKNDLLVYGTLSTPSAAQFQVLFGNGDGTFSPATAVPAGGFQFVTSAEINGDGRDDVVAASIDSPPGEPIVLNRILLLASNRDGSFRELPSLTTGEYAWIVHPADLNGDTHTDLGVGTTHYENNMGNPGPSFIFYGRGDGTFDPGPVDVLDRVPYDLVAGDFNRDGIQDFANLGVWDDVQVQLGVGDGTFRAQPFFYAGIDNRRLVDGDFDRDGLVDFAVLANRSEAVFTFAGNGDGTFGPGPIPAIDNALLNAMAAGDFNSDGRIDVAAARLDTDEVSVLVLNGDGKFETVARAPVAPGPSAVAVADFNRDGRLDLAVASVNWHDYVPEPAPPGTLIIFLGGGGGTLAPSATYETGPFPYDLSASDLNGDGVVDLAMLVFRGAYGLAPDVDTFLGRGDGSFAPGGVAAAGKYAVAIALGDLNGDGKQDLAVANRGYYSEQFPYPHVDGEVSMMLGNGDGTFQARTVLARLFSPSGIATSDLNADGILDLAVTDEGTLWPDNPGGVTAFIGNGGGQFAAGPALAAGIGPLDIDIADYNNDGIKDLAVPSNSYDTSILPGLGDGTFGPASRYGLFGTPPFLAYASSARTQVLDLTLSFLGRTGRSRALVSWRTDREWSIRGFNIVNINDDGRRIQLNREIIPCHECDTGAGSVYSYLARGRGLGRGVFLEVVYRDGHIETFGPATRQ